MTFWAVARASQTMSELHHDLLVVGSRQAEHWDMSSRKEHDAYGGVAGLVAAVGFALMRSGPVQPMDLLAEAIGGYLGGRYLGSPLPDVFEPATSSHHRSTMHSVAVTSLVAYGGATRVNEVAESLRRSADQHAENVAQQPEKATEEQLMRFLKRMAAGAVVGVPAGYISHNLADSWTPRSIPLVTRGF